ncbi:MAG: hypothetical protein LBH07_00240 [Treponema sp.]|jgi:hypothetical protein|nr:hypothetical protein [Treponema sp.]
MKRLVLFVVVFGIGVSLFAQIQLPEHYFAAGNWTFTGNRLYQNDATAGLAKVNMRIPQSGPMIYEFNVRYEDGIQTGQGGFGIHVFADDVYNGPSWGSGTSYLIWLNYDENPVLPGFPKGFTAQVYRSYSNSRMDLIESFDLNEFEDLLTFENVKDPLPVKIWIDGNTGEVRIYDPSDIPLEEYFYFYLPTRNLRGNWISLRTNGLKMSFGMGLGLD